VRTTDGEVFETEVHDRSGNSAHPLSEEQIRDKYLEQATPVLGTEHAERLMRIVEHLEDVSDVRELACATGRVEDGGTLS
jgi:hypothetical protein